jgi:hypothetical protein
MSPFIMDLFSSAVLDMGKLVRGQIELAVVGLLVNDTQASSHARRRLRHAQMSLTTTWNESMNKHFKLEYYAQNDSVQIAVAHRHIYFSPWWGNCLKNVRLRACAALSLAKDPDPCS